jgi:hypothetical protein
MSIPSPSRIGNELIFSRLDINLPERIDTGTPPDFESNWLSGYYFNYNAKLCRMHGKLQFAGSYNEKHLSLPILRTVITDLEMLELSI